MDSSIIQGLDLAVSPDNRRLHTPDPHHPIPLPARQGSDKASTQDSGARAETSSTSGASQGQDEQARMDEGFFPSDHGSLQQSSSEGDSDSLSDPSGPSAASGQIVNPATESHARPCVDPEIASRDRPDSLEGDVYGNAAESDLVLDEIIQSLPSHGRIQADTWAVQGDETASDDRLEKQLRDDQVLSEATGVSQATCQPTVADILSSFASVDSVSQCWINGRASRLWLVHDTGEVCVGMVDAYAGQYAEQFAQKLEAETTRRAAGFVLIVEDLNLDMCKVLSSRYPELDQVFLAEHILRLDEPLTEDSLKKLLRDFRVCQLGNNWAHVEFSEDSDDEGRNARIRLDLPFTAQDQRCFHVDIELAASSKGAYLNKLEATLSDGRIAPFREQRRCRRECFSSRIDGSWRKKSTRVSCSPLSGDSTLILLDAASNINEETYAPYKIPEKSTLSWRLSLDFGTFESRHPFYDNVQLRLALVMLVRFHNRQSIFHPPVLRGNMLGHHPLHIRPDRVSVLLWFLLVALWEIECLSLQQDLQYVRSYAMREAGERSFSLLIAVRSHLGRVRNGINFTRNDMSREMKDNAEYGWFVKGPDGGYAFQDDAPKHSRKPMKQSKMPSILAFAVGDKSSPLDWRCLPDVLSQLESWIDVVGKVINEDIQIAIGAVQVEDARTMKRQTEWTVVLGVLAAIYLPLTLVTGIFGMNISEITAPESAPSKWSVVKAWGIVFGATLGSILLYTALKLLLRSWRILRLIYQKILQRRTPSYIYLIIRILMFGKDKLMNWQPVRALGAPFRKFRKIVRRVKELDLEAQKRD